MVGTQVATLPNGRHSWLYSAVLVAVGARGADVRSGQAVRLRREPLAGVHDVPGRTFRQKESSLCYENLTFTTLILLQPGFGWANTTLARYFMCVLIRSAPIDRSDRDVGRGGRLLGVIVEIPSTSVGFLINGN